MFNVPCSVSIVEQTFYFNYLISQKSTYSLYKEIINQQINQPVNYPIKKCNILFRINNNISNKNNNAKPETLNAEHGTRNVKLQTSNVFNLSPACHS